MAAFTRLPKEHCARPSAMFWFSRGRRTGAPVLAVYSAKTASILVFSVCALNGLTM